MPINFFDDEGAVRMSEEDARKAIEAWLDKHVPGYPDYSLCEDGEKSWAFWITWHDTTSYLHWNGRIEWYGSLWPDHYDYDEGTGNWLSKEEA